VVTVVWATRPASESVRTAGDHCTAGQLRRVGRRSGARGWPSARCAAVLRVSVGAAPVHASGCPLTGRTPQRQALPADVSNVTSGGHHPTSVRRGAGWRRLSWRRCRRRGRLPTCTLLSGGGHGAVQLPPTRPGAVVGDTARCTAQRLDSCMTLHGQPLHRGKCVVVVTVSRWRATASLATRPVTKGNKKRATAC